MCHPVKECLSWVLGTAGWRDEAVVWEGTLQTGNLEVILEGMLERRPGLGKDKVGGRRRVVHSVGISGCAWDRMRAGERKGPREPEAKTIVCVETEITRNDDQCVAGMLEGLSEV